MKTTSALSKSKKILFTFILGFISVSASLVLGEIVLRLLGYQGVPSAVLENIRQIDDPVLNWRHEPNSIRIGEGNITFRYNNKGFRDRDHKIDKPLGVRRVVVVGDSVTEGYGVEWESIFSKVLQASFDEKKENVEVVNIAQGGLNAPQEIHLFKEAGLVYKPDLVVLNFVLNDPDFFSKYRVVDCDRGHPDCEIKIFNLFDLKVGINPEVKYFLRRFALFNFVNERTQHLLGNVYGSDEQVHDYFKLLWSKESNRRKVVNGFNQLANLQNQHHFKVLILIWPILTDYSHYSYKYIHEWVEEKANGFGFSVIDLLPQFSEYSFQELQVMSLDHVHPNALGHKIAAEAFFSWRDSQGNVLGSIQIH